MPFAWGPRFGEVRRLRFKEKRLGRVRGCCCLRLLLRVLRACNTVCACSASLHACACSAVCMPRACLCVLFVRSALCARSASFVLGQILCGALFWQALWLEHPFSVCLRAFHMCLQRPLPLGKLSMFCFCKCCGLGICFCSFLLQCAVSFCGDALCFPLLFFFSFFFTPAPIHQF